MFESMESLEKVYLMIFLIAVIGTTAYCHFAHWESPSALSSLQVQSHTVMKSAAVNKSAIAHGVADAAR